jgi:hypothetical protein
MEERDDMGSEGFQRLFFFKKKKMKKKQGRYFTISPAIY